MGKLLIAFGYKQRRGKDESCNFLEKYITNNTLLRVQRINFADALRKEVHDRLIGSITLKDLCEFFKVEYDPNPEVNATYPFGKQRKLLQHYGTEYRRAQDPDYWTKQTQRAIDASTADVILISDMRFKNELALVREQGVAVKLERPGFMGDVGSAHRSETELDGATFDYCISARSLTDLHRQVLNMFIMETSFRSVAARWDNITSQVCGECRS